MGNKKSHNQYRNAMLIEKYYCNGCKRTTHHKEIKKDFFECERCHYTEIRTTIIRKNDIDNNNVAYFLYSSNEFLYFNDSLSQIIISKKDMKDLLDGNKIRIPLYRNKKFGQSKF